MYRCTKAICAALVLLIPLPCASGQTDPFALLFGEEPKIDASTDGRAGKDDIRFLGLQLGELKLSNTLTAYAVADGICVLPDGLFSVLEAPISVSERGADGWFVRPENTVRIDTETASATIANRAPFDIKESLHQTQDGWCLALAAWSDILPIDFTYDPRSLSLKLDPREPLPVEARLEREALRKSLNLGTEFQRPYYRAIKNPYRWLSLPTADVSIDLRAGSTGQTRVNGQIELSGDVLWSSARVRSAQNLDGSQGVRATLDRVFETADGSLKPRQIQVGDILSPNQPLIPQASSARGVSITNRAPYRADIFDITDIRGPLPVGWEAELYRDSQLVDFVTEPNDLGEYRFTDVQIRPGFNRFTVRLFGPFGETDVRHVKFFAGAEMQPENTVEYDVALFESGISVDGNQTDDRKLIAAASLSAGLRQNLSARLDVRATPGETPWAVASLIGAAGETNGVVRVLGSSPYGPGLEVGAAHLFKDSSSLEARYNWFAGTDRLDGNQPSQKQVLAA